MNDLRLGNSLPNGESKCNDILNGKANNKGNTIEARSNKSKNKNKSKSNKKGNSTRKRKTKNEEQRKDALNFCAIATLSVVYRNTSVLKEHGDYRIKVCRPFRVCQYQHPIRKKYDHVVLWLHQLWINHNFGNGDFNSKWTKYCRIICDAFIDCVEYGILLLFLNHTDISKTQLEIGCLLVCKYVKNMKIVDIIDTMDRLLDYDGKKNYLENEQETKYFKYILAILREIMQNSRELTNSVESCPLFEKGKKLFQIIQGIRVCMNQLLYYIRSCSDRQKRQIFSNNRELRNNQRKPIINYIQSIFKDYCNQSQLKAPIALNRACSSNTNSPPSALPQLTSLLTDTSRLLLLYTYDYDWTDIVYHRQFSSTKCCEKCAKYKENFESTTDLEIFNDFINNEILVTECLRGGKIKKDADINTLRIKLQLEIAGNGCQYVAANKFSDILNQRGINKLSTLLQHPYRKKFQLLFHGVDVVGTGQESTGQEVENNKGGHGSSRSYSCNDIDMKMYGDEKDNSVPRYTGNINDYSCSDMNSDSDSDGARGDEVNDLGMGFHYCNCTLGILPYTVMIDVNIIWEIEKLKDKKFKENFCHVMHQSYAQSHINHKTFDMKKYEGLCDVIIQNEEKYYCLVERFCDTRADWITFFDVMYENTRMQIDFNHLKNATIRKSRQHKQQTKLNTSIDFEPKWQEISDILIKYGKRESTLFELYQKIEEMRKKHQSIKERNNVYGKSMEVESVKDEWTSMKKFLRLLSNLAKVSKRDFGQMKKKNFYDQVQYMLSRNYIRVLFDCSIFPYSQFWRLDGTRSGYYRILAGLRLIRQLHQSAVLHICYLNYEKDIHGIKPSKNNNNKNNNKNNNNNNKNFMTGSKRTQKIKDTTDIEIISMEPDAKRRKLNSNSSTKASNINDNASMTSSSFSTKITSKSNNNNNNNNTNNSRWFELSDQSATRMSDPNHNQHVNDTHAQHTFQVSNISMGDDNGCMFVPGSGVIHLNDINCSNNLSQSGGGRNLSNINTCSNTMNNVINGSIDNFCNSKIDGINLHCSQPQDSFCVQMFEEMDKMDKNLQNNGYKTSYFAQESANLDENIDTDAILNQLSTLKATNSINQVFGSDNTMDVNTDGGENCDIANSSDSQIDTSCTENENISSLSVATLEKEIQELATKIKTMKNYNLINGQSQIKKEIVVKNEVFHVKYNIVDETSYDNPLFLGVGKSTRSCKRIENAFGKSLYFDACNNILNKLKNDRQNIENQENRIIHWCSRLLFINYRKQNKIVLIGNYDGCDVNFDGANEEDDNLQSYVVGTNCDDANHPIFILMTHVENLNFYKLQRDFPGKQKQGYVWNATFLKNLKQIVDDCFLKNNYRCLVTEREKGQLPNQRMVYIRKRFDKCSRGEYDVKLKRDNRKKKNSSGKKDCDSSQKKPKLYQSTRKGMGHFVTANTHTTHYIVTNDVDYNPHVVDSTGGLIVFGYNPQGMKHQGTTNIDSKEKGAIVTTTEMNENNKNGDGIRNINFDSSINYSINFDGHGDKLIWGRNSDRNIFVETKNDPNDPCMVYCEFDDYTPQSCREIYHFANSFSFDFHRNNRSNYGKNKNFTNMVAHPCKNNRVKHVNDMNPRHKWQGGPPTLDTYDDRLSKLKLKSYPKKTINMSDCIRDRINSTKQTFECYFFKIIKTTGKQRNENNNRTNENEDKTKNKNDKRNDSSKTVANNGKTEIDIEDDEECDGNDDNYNDEVEDSDINISINTAHVDGVSDENNKEIRSELFEQGTVMFGTRSDFDVIYIVFNMFERTKRKKLRIARNVSMWDVDHRFQVQLNATELEIVQSNLINFDGKHSVQWRDAANKSGKYKSFNDLRLR